MTEEPSRRVGSLSIVPVEDADIDDLASLYTQLIEHTPDPAAMRFALRKASDNPNHLLLAAKDGDKLIGSCAGIVCETLVGKCRPFMVVEDLVVAGGARRSGVASALMHALEAAARAKRCSYILLLTNRARQDARRFYLSLGYDCDDYLGFKKTLSGNT